jgi:hypothetical protein
MSKLEIPLRSKPYAESFREVIMALRSVLNAKTASGCERETAGLGHFIEGLHQ